MSTSSASNRTTNTSIFNQMREETWALCTQGVNVNETSRILHEKFGDATPPIGAIYKWRREFRGGKGERQANREEEDRIEQQMDEYGLKPAKISKNEVRKYCATCNREFCSRNYYEQHMLKHHQVFLGDSKPMLDILSNIPQAQRRNLIFRCDSCLQVTGYLDFENIEELQAHKLQMHGQTMNIPSWAISLTVTRNKLRTLSSSPTSKQQQGKSNTTSDNDSTKTKRYSTPLKGPASPIKNKKSRNEATGRFSLSRRHLLQRDFSLPSPIVRQQLSSGPMPILETTGLRRSARIPKPRTELLQAMVNEEAEQEQPIPQEQKPGEKDAVSVPDRDNQQQLLQQPQQKQQQQKRTSGAMSVAVNKIKQEELETAALVEAALKQQKQQPEPQKQQQNNVQPTAVNREKQNTAVKSGLVRVANWDASLNLFSPAQTNSSVEAEQGNNAEALLTPRTVAAAVALCELAPSTTSTTTTVANPTTILNACSPVVIKQTVVVATPASAASNANENASEMQQQRGTTKIAMVNQQQQSVQHETKQKKQLVKGNKNTEQKEQSVNKQLPQQNIAANVNHGANEEEPFVTIMNDGRIEMEEPEVNGQSQQQESAALTNDNLGRKNSDTSTTTISTVVDTVPTPATTKSSTTTTLASSGLMQQQQQPPQQTLQQLPPQQQQNNNNNNNQQGIRQRMLSPAALDAADSMLKLARAASAAMRSPASSTTTTTSTTTTLNPISSIGTQPVEMPQPPSSPQLSSSSSSLSSALSSSPSLSNKVLQPNVHIVALEAQAERHDAPQQQQKLVDNTNNQDKLDLEQQPQQHGSSTRLEIVKAIANNENAKEKESTKEINTALTAQTASVATNTIVPPTNSNAISAVAIDANANPVMPSPPASTPSVIISVPQDDCTWFGHSIAAQLRIMSGTTKDLAKIRIQKVIYDCNLPKEAVNPAKVKSHQVNSASVSAIPSLRTKPNNVGGQRSNAVQNGNENNKSSGSNNNKKNSNAAS